MRKENIVKLFVVILFIVFTVSFLDGLKRNSEENELNRIKSTIEKSVLECYAIEGEYPEDLDYLKDNYGLYINNDACQIHYRYIGSNMRPEIMVFEKGERR